MTTVPELDACLAPGLFVDSDHPSVIAFAEHESAGLDDPRAIAIRLYEAVRDSIRYDPYRIDLSVEGLKASRCLTAGHGFCVPKSALLAAAARVRGIPARLGYADVLNHLTSPRLQAMFGQGALAFHGYAELLLDGRWVKATPVFDLALCVKAGIRPLEFDGMHDSIFHPWDVSGRRHMEYVRERGTYADVPRDALLAVWREMHPMFDQSLHGVDGSADFEAEVARH